MAKLVTGDRDKVIDRLMRAYPKADRAKARDVVLWAEYARGRKWERPDEVPGTSLTCKDGTYTLITP